MAKLQFDGYNLHFFELVVTSTYKELIIFVAQN